MPVRGRSHGEASTLLLPAARRAAAVCGRRRAGGATPAPPKAAKPSPAEIERNEALELYRQGRYREALPTLEKLAGAAPGDKFLQELWGLAVLGTASGLKDAEERKRERARARKILVRARELGADSGLLLIMLDTLPEDGSEASFSSRKEVDEAMREGEVAFGAHNYDQALAAYTRALLLDPNNYTAALFAGDVFFARKAMGSAGEWFARAVQIDPDQETAYRYWGDSLAYMGKHQEARAKFIEAIVAEPYSRAPWVGLKQWADHVGVTLSHPRIQSPNSITEKDGQTRITIDPSTLKSKDGSSRWLFYEIARAAWKTKQFREQFPGETEYRHSLKEEAQALRMVADQVADDVAKGDVKELEPGLAALLKLEKADLLEAYILFARADEGISRDYPASRKENRDRLRRYLDEFVVPPVPKQFTAPQQP